MDGCDLSLDERKLGPGGGATAADVRIRELEARLAELEMQRESFRLLVEQAVDGIFVSDAAGRYVEVNTAGCQMLGYTRDELLSRSIADVLAEDEVHRIGTEAARFAGGAVARSEWRFLRKDGSTFVGEVVGRALSDGRLQAILRDITEREQTREALSAALTATEEQRRELAAVFDALPLAITITDAAGGIVRTNGRDAEIWGQRPPTRGVEEYHQYKAWWVETGKPVEPSEWASAQAVLSGRTVIGQMLEIERFDGERRFVLNSAAPIRDAAGAIAGSAVAIQDVTALHQAREALRESERRFAAIYDHAPFAIALMSVPDGRIAEVNQAWERVFDCSRDEAIGKTTVELGLAADPDSRARMHEVIRTHGTVRNWEMAYRTRTGRLRLASFSFDLIEVSGRPFHLGTAIDITERKAAEEALRQGESRMQLLSETAARLLATDDPQGLVNELCQGVMAHLDCQAFFNFLVDAQAGKLRLNACAGIPEQDVNGIEWLDYGVAICGCAAQDQCRIIAEDIQRSTDRRAALVRSFGMQAYCCHPLMAAGRLLGTLSFGTRTRPSFSPADVELMRTVADQVAVAMERVLAKQALSEANTRLREADQRKNEFLAVLSHELRNPLSPITNSLHILDNVPPGSEKANRARQIIGRQVAQLATLVNELLDITRISRNKVQLRKEWLDLNEVALRAVEDNRSVFDHAQVDLELSLASREVPLRADRTRITQIIGNLLRNAAKFTGEGGHARVIVAVEGDEAVVRVTDDGLGMSPDTVSRLFQPFAQADRTLDRSAGGLGIGLALVKGLVELHGGRVSAHSDGPGRGAQFAVRFPLDVSANLAPAASPAPTSSVRRRVLIIEDHVDAASTLRDALELLDHDVATAHSGPKGLEKARVFKPEFVLCDIGLPGMDGYDVARAFRADGELKEVHLIALSGYALPDDLRRAAEAGFEHHIAKPPNLERLEELLRDVGDVA